MKKKIKKKPVSANVSVSKQKRETRRRRAVELYRQGYSCNKIAVKLNTNSHTIACDLHAMGQHVKTQKAKTKRNAALIKDRIAGKKVSCLAEKYKISEDRVKEILSNYNKTAAKPIPDFRTLQGIRLKKQHAKLKQKKARSTKTTTKPEKELTPTKKRAAARLQRIIAMYNAGLKIKVIAKRCKLTENRVYQLLRNEGL
ncbi:MAG: hypothetical protein LBG58_11090 [Planctomycetaceae bacterium]|jgi:Mor family transcriptional regulator|nr:hypothetical protein [Planctomycetaceae bacterium]